jgi:hypothetical protein
LQNITKSGCFPVPVLANPTTSVVLDSNNGMVFLLNLCWDHNFHFACISGAEIPKSENWFCIFLILYFKDIGVVTDFIVLDSSENPL